MPQSSAYLFSTCQVGAEAALKADMARREPTLHLAFSRPGFVTFKLPADYKHGHAPWQSAFARTQGFSLGKCTLPAPDHDAADGSQRKVLATDFLRLIEGVTFNRLHVWQRDTATPGFHGFEPAITPLANEARRALLDALARDVQPPIDARQLERPTSAGDTVLDCIVVEPDLWWAGWHTAERRHSCWPGGIPPIELPADAVSRAWLKMEEALQWSQLPLRENQRVAEIGCAPGGAAQALLARGLHVLGIDPALVDERVAAHPHFTQLRKRGHEVRRREFRRMHWLVVDMNVAPRYTLDTVEAIATHPEVNLRGMLLTLKLLDWKLAGELPLYLARIRSWGFRDVRARQLTHNRQEVCVSAQRMA